MKHYKIYYYFAFLIFNFTIIAAPLTNLPITIKQPDGKVIHCFASGDEFHNWIHDKDNYTIIQDQKTGYWTYAVKVNNVISASNYIVGQDDPKSLNLLKGINLSPEEILQKRNNILKARFSKRSNSLQNLTPENTLAPSKGIVNNLAIFVRFADDPEFTEDISYYEKLFNTGEGSVRNYFLEDSYGKLTLNTHFFPQSENKTLSYKDIFRRGYFAQYNGTTNPEGYATSLEKETRKSDLLKRVIYSIKNQIPAEINFDSDKDSYIDNICFVIFGTPPGNSDLLWPHYGHISDSIKINNKNINGYTLVMNLENSSPDYLFNIICHETGHTIGFPDLYRHINSGLPVGGWDMMADNVGHSGAWMKYRYTGWIETIPEIEKNGSYSINDITKPNNNCYKIRSSMSSDEFFVVEFRKKEGQFEKGIPGSGLLVTRINSGRIGNASGPPDEIYYLRPNKDGYTSGDITNAFFSSESGRTRLDFTTNPSLAFSNKNSAEVEINNIGSSLGNSIGFSVKRKNRISVKTNGSIVSSKSGVLNVSIFYTFPYQDNKWTASITLGQSWIRIISDSSGTNNAQINIAYDENILGVPRSGIIKIYDPESIDSPVEIIFNQMQPRAFFEAEPNDMMSQANPIEYGDIVYGSINPYNESDYYSFSANEGDTVRLSYTDNNSSLSGFILFLNNNGLTIQTSSRKENESTIYTLIIPSNSTFFIKIRSSQFGVPSGNRSPVNYVFDILKSGYIHETIAKPPEISNFTVSGRGFNSVLMKANISTYGLPTIVQIEYGKSTNYGNTIYPSGSPFVGSLLGGYIVNLFESIPGLELNKKYHFRLVAQNNMGTVFSDDCEASIDSQTTFITEIEPNNIKEQANQIYYGDSICASINTSADMDFYRFNANIGDIINVRLNDSSNSSKGALYIYVNQQMRMSGSTDNGIINIKYQIPATGLYYVYVQTKSGNNYAFNYSLVLDKFKKSAPNIFGITFYSDAISEIDYNSIRIYPSFSTNGLPTTLRVQYGTTINYGRSIILSGSPFISNNYYYDFKTYAQETITGLESNTTYHIRLIAENDLGIAYSKDYKAATLPKPFGYELLPYNDSLIYLNCFALVDQNTLIVSSNGYSTNPIFRSSDQGKTWKRCDDNIYSANSISTFDGINIMAGSSSYIYKSTDSGNNWSAVINKSSTNFSSIFSIDHKTTYAVGYSYSTSPNIYFIIKTTDGGTTWNTLVSSTKSQLYKISFIDENNGFVLGEKGLIMKTKDGGLNWTEQKIDTTYNFDNIYFSDNNNGFIVGDFYRTSSYTDSTGKVFNTYNYSSLILRTTNSGNTWVRQNITTTNQLNFIIFNSKNNGIIVGSGGIILKTTNAGDSWINQPSGTTDNLIGACFLDPSTVMIVGSNGTIIKGNFNSEPIYETTDFKLSNNYPNPFNSQTNIEYSIPEDGLVKIKIYDILGREVETILNENQKSGKYGISWKPQNVATGIYYYRIEAGKYKETKKLLYLK